jgi:hypothetical protein
VEVSSQQDSEYGYSVAKVLCLQSGMQQGKYGIAHDAHPCTRTAVEGKDVITSQLPGQERRLLSLRNLSAEGRNCEIAHHMARVQG